MIVVAKGYGRLGNRLTLFAHLLAFAREHGVRVVNPAFSEYSRFFEAWRHDWLCRYPLRSSTEPAWPAGHRGLVQVLSQTGKWIHRLKLKSPARSVFLADDEVFDLGNPRFVVAAQTRPVFLRGWLFRDPDCLDKHADHVRDLFRPAEIYRRKIAASIAAMRRDCDILIGVHIRRGDYRSYAGGQFLYTDDQYRRAMDRVQHAARGQRIGFFVCSDAPVDVPFFAPHRVFTSVGQVIEDLYSLAECDYIIGPPSTFSGWAAFYGDRPLWHMHTADEEMRWELGWSELGRRRPVAGPSFTSLSRAA